MLTADLVQARRRSGKLHPRWLDDAARDRMRPAATAAIAAYRSGLGSTREQLDHALDGLRVRPQDRTLLAGLRKLLDDHATFEVDAALDAELLREAVFLEASSRHQSLGLTQAFNRQETLHAVAQRLGLESADLERGLYADLRGAEVLRHVAPLEPEELLDLYDLALAQAVLLRAVRVRVGVRGETADTYRRLFRAVRFHGLVCQVEGSQSEGYTLTLDGPFSLFDSVQRYGLRLGMFLPHVLRCRHFELEAELAWGKGRERLTFSLNHRSGLRAPDEELPALGPVAEALREGIERLGGPWRANPNERLFPLADGSICVPDLWLTHVETGEEAYVEVFGFWSRDAVWRRIEGVRRGFPARLLLAVGKQLRVSEQVLDESDAAELWVYKQTPSARALIERLERRFQPS